MNLFSVADSPDLVSVQINAEETVLCAQYHPVLIDETGGQCCRVLDHANSVVQDLATTEDSSI